MKFDNVAAGAEGSCADASCADALARHAAVESVEDGAPRTVTEATSRERHCFTLPISGEKIGELSAGDLRLHTAVEGPIKLSGGRRSGAGRWSSASADAREWSRMRLGSNLWDGASSGELSAGECGAVQQWKNVAN